MKSNSTMKSPDHKNDIIHDKLVYNIFCMYIYINTDLYIANHIIISKSLHHSPTKTFLLGDPNSNCKILASTPRSLKLAHDQRTNKNFFVIWNGNNIFSDSKYRYWYECVPTYTIYIYICVHVCIYTVCTVRCLKKHVWVNLSESRIHFLKSWRTCWANKIHGKIVWIYIYICVNVMLPSARFETSAIRIHSSSFPPSRSLVPISCNKSFTVSCMNKMHGKHLQSQFLFTFSLQSHNLSTVIPVIPPFSQDRFQQKPSTKKHKRIYFFQRNISSHRRPPSWWF